MTASAGPLLEPEVVRARRRPGSTLEFLLVGGATLVLFPAAWLLKGALGLDDAELVVGFLAFHAAHVINDPHFAVTYLLFYKDFKRRAFGDAFTRAQRARYWIAGALAPAVLLVWAVASLFLGSARGLGLLLQLMFLLVGWHYVKQGFGVLSVLSARRGARFTLLERRAFLAHCYAGWAYAWASPADPGRDLEESGVVFRSLSHPPGLESLSGAVFAASALLLAVVLLQKRRREGRWPPRAPLIGLLVTVWLWTVYSSIDPVMVYVIPALHSIQYLYFVWLLRRNEARAAEGAPSFGRPARERLFTLAVSAVALGWLLLRALPGAFDEILVAKHPDATDRLGATPFFAAFFAFVNLHHYFMDAVIWRRENPETRHLLAAEPDISSTPVRLVG